MFEETYSKEKELEGIKNTVLQMPNSLGSLYNKFNQEERKIYLHLILYNDIGIVSDELNIGKKVVKKVEDKARRYLIGKVLSFHQDIKKLEENLSLRADKLNTELSDVVSEH